MLEAAGCIGVEGGKVEGFKDWGLRATNVEESRQEAERESKLRLYLCIHPFDTDSLFVSSRALRSR